MRKIVLVIGANATGISLDDTETKIEINDIFEKYPPEISENPLDFRVNAISKCLDNTVGNLVIGNAVDSIREYLNLKEELKRRKVVIDQVFIKRSEYTEEDIDSLYNQQLFRREYTLNEIGQLAEAHKENISELAKKIMEDEVEMVYVS